MSERNLSHDELIAVCQFVDRAFKRFHRDHAAMRGWGDEVRGPDHRDLTDAIREELSATMAAATHHERNDMTKSGWCSTHLQPLTACGSILHTPPDTLVFTPEQGSSNPILDLSTFSEDERRVFRLLATRIEAGRSKYGPLNLSEDRRDFRRESAEERTDALFYDLVEDLRRGDAWQPASDPPWWADDRKAGILREFGYEYDIDRLAYVNLASRVVFTVEVIQSHSPAWLKERASSPQHCDSFNWMIHAMGGISDCQRLAWMVDLEDRRACSMPARGIVPTPEQHETETAKTNQAGTSTPQPVWSLGEIPHPLDIDEIEAIEKRGRGLSEALGWNCIPRSTSGHPHQVAEDITRLIAEVRRLRKGSGAKRSAPTTASVGFGTVQIAETDAPIEDPTGQFAFPPDAWGDPAYQTPSPTEDTDNPPRQERCISWFWWDDHGANVIRIRVRCELKGPHDYHRATLAGSCGSAFLRWMVQGEQSVP